MAPTVRQASHEEPELGEAEGSEATEIRRYSGWQRLDSSRQRPRRGSSDHDNEQAARATAVAAVW